ncbi:hypothetical protein KY311_01755 [Candidatus Woesearchaeota archaeon]|nr:hypothetical protein [Candidatus Woesearchaeota archaeon]MBW3017059.1 hypothetical protein [Candidatus Woesearchaeota archaeon]
MLIKILGILDLFAALCVILGQYDIISFRLALFFGIVLILKGIIFKENWASYADLGIGVYLILSVFGLHALIISYAAAIYLGQKSFFSLFA